ncbi:phosphoglucomutase (alpha-D-glucose-1,6-bisphosphate-dependent) [Pseudomonas typographi]|uniref:Phosphoglucomutase n=1 Tax=Pseudomonas typographi TaxID=2715964 RepID=A0ABR7Z0I0_9PSED|nr:phosphoglucomutase (alpha-D-glucose-1,6-bisphosphate-dependent) [Pseudomonas typographi]MBD1551365.1 alpha-D-glucose phosphate-specific phosphoglucomutase [Pseudomonas typographi]MBD1586418.1 alpha-D-glucose phosphate-specific phosphoglucomutase [Pseudomonas typographi]MBD1598869.1 alpha-D-glucose phosphate-specific phosphoglucomutase [Pseudomonas typographi]
MTHHPLAGRPAPAEMLVDIPKLVSAYYTGRPDPAVASHRVAFGTSGHRGCSFDNSFNEAQVLAISQAICLYRQTQGIDGPLFLGLDTHALSTPAGTTALEVFAANGVEVMLATDDEYTPTPAVSHAILCYNQGRSAHLADGVVITPSHNPPQSGGYKYNPPNGGPADSDVTQWIEAKANALLEAGLKAVKRMPYDQALKAATTHRHDYLNRYVEDLANVIDLAAIRDSGLRLGVDPLGGAGVRYWPAIAERYGLNLEVVNRHVDPTFRFMTVDWDGQIRMDPSSADAMQGLLALKDRFDVAFACDPDHDRHGIVTPQGGLLSPNNYLAVMVDYLYQNRPQWRATAAVGKTVVSSALIDRVAARLGRKLFEVPVGFKYFAQGLFDGSLGFGGEESAGASFLRQDGGVWTTDKDGLIPSLLAAEITAKTGKNPYLRYRDLAAELGEPFATRVDAKADAQQKAALSKLSAEQVSSTELAGEPIEAVLSRAPGNDQAIGGLKVVTANGWFAARPSGTEAIYKIYAESFIDPAHLQRLVGEAQALVDKAIS